jgi:acyl-CoA thioester hydrolase
VPQFGIALFSQSGLTNAKLEELKIGPVLLREEAVFRREIKFEDKIVVDVEMTKSLPDFSRWSLHHHFYKEDNTLAATLNMDVVWIDLIKRKSTIPPIFVQEIFKRFPRAKNFEWGDPLRKELKG